MENRTFTPKKSYCIALGFFDCMHLGHQEIFRTAINFATKAGIGVAVFTFNTDANKAGGKQLYAYNERVELYKKQGISEVIAYPFNDETKGKSGEEFLDELVRNYGAVAFCCGEDYRFGAGASCGVDFLKDYCDKNGLTLIIAPTVVSNGEKVSSTTIKSLITAREIERANALLSEPYFIQGEVVKGRGVGHIFGFPTANIVMREDRISLSEGVYGGYITIENKSYRAVTNIGAKPTFGDYTPTIESYIVDYNGNAYGKTAKLSLVKFLRPIKKFDSPDALREQIYMDAKWTE